MMTCMGMPFVTQHIADLYLLLARWSPPSLASYTSPSLAMSSVRPARCSFALAIMLIKLHRLDAGRIKHKVERRGDAAVQDATAVAAELSGSTCAEMSRAPFLGWMNDATVSLEDLCQMSRSGEEVHGFGLPLGAILEDSGLEGLASACVDQIKQGDLHAKTAVKEWAADFNTKLIELTCPADEATIEEAAPDVVDLSGSSCAEMSKDSFLDMMKGATISLETLCQMSRSGKKEGDIAWPLGAMLEDSSFSGFASPCAKMLMKQPFADQAEVDDWATSFNAKLMEMACPA